MSIIVRCDSEFLQVTGDVVTRLAVPLPIDLDSDATFALAISDGTLIEGLLDDYGGYEFSVVQEGAGITRFEADGFVHEWQVESVTISPLAFRGSQSEGDSRHGKEARPLIGIEAVRDLLEGFQGKWAETEPIQQT